MKTMAQLTELGELMTSRQASVDPSKYPDEVFDLLSIPAYDNGAPDVVCGSDIGSSKKVVEPGDVLLSRIVPHIRRAWVVPEANGKRQIASGEWIVFRGSQFDPNYLRHLLTSDVFHVQFMNTVAGVGGSLLRARPAFVAKIEIPLPPLPEQKRIADILDKADALRRKRQEAETHFDTLLKSTFIQMFGNPIRNPMEWDVEPLGLVATLDRGKSRHRPRDAKFLYGGPYPLVQTGDITNSNGFVRNYSQTYSEEGLAQSRLWPAGTLCITIAANIGKTAVLTFDACFPDSVVGLITGEKLTIEYIRQWFVAMEKTTDAAATQVAQKNINLAYLRNLNVQIPPITKQHEFSSAVTKIRQSRENAEAAQLEATALFNSLVQRAFKGEL